MPIESVPHPFQKLDYIEYGKHIRTLDWSSFILKAGNECAKLIYNIYKERWNDIWHEACDI